MEGKGSEPAEFPSHPDPNRPRRVFGKFRKRRGKVENSTCWYCPNTKDDPAHSILRCGRWEEERIRLMEKLVFNNVPRHPRAILERAQASEEKWSSWMDFVNTVMTKKTEKEYEIEKGGASEERAGET